MDQKNFKLELITQEKVLIKQDVKSVVAPSGKGLIGILPGHAPLLGNLVTGILKARDAAEKEFRAFVDKGFFMIAGEGVTIIAQSAEMEDRINVERAVAAKQRAEKIIASKDGGMDMERAKYALLRAELRIEAAKGSAH